MEQRTGGRGQAEDPSGPAETGRLARAGQWLVRARGSDGSERQTLLLVLKSAVAATIAWVVSHDLMHAQSPAFAPFSAVLMVQVTIYQSIAQSLRYTLAVTLGVAVQLVLGLIAGPDLLTFAMVALAALVIGRWRRLGAQGSQVATAAFFAFSSYITATTTAERLGALGEIVLLVLVGCAVGVLVNLLLVPPMRYRSAEYGVRALAHSLCDLLGDLYPALQDNDLDKERTEQWRYRAERMASTVARARSSVATAQESVYYNPRRLLARHKGRTTFHGYRQLVDSLERVSGQLLAMIRSLDQSSDLDRSAEAHREFFRRYGEFLATIGEVTRLFGEIDEDRLGEQARRLCASAETARACLEELSEGTRRSTVDLADHTQTYGILLADAARLMDEAQHTCDVLQQCVDNAETTEKTPGRRSPTDG